MQGKGIVRFFTIVLLLVVGYQFFLMIPKRSVESNADRYARTAAAAFGDVNSDSAMVAAEKAKQYFLDSVSTETVFSIGVKDYTYQELARQQLGLGLDLKGGMSVTLQVDLSDLIFELGGKNTDTVFTGALSKAKQLQKNSQDNFVVLFQQAFEELAPNKKMAPIFSVGQRLKEAGINTQSSNDEVIAAIRTASEESVSLTYNRLKQRIDKFGVTQPNVSLDESTDRITVELPGVTNPERARKYLQATANLEFWETFTLNEVYADMAELDQLLKAKEVPQDTAANDSTDVEETAGPLFKKLAANPNGGPVVGQASTGDTAAINAIFKTEEAKAVFGIDVRFLWDQKANVDKTTGKRFISLYAINTRGAEKAPLQGDCVTQAYATKDPSTGRNVVLVDMDDQGAQDWREMTKQNVNRSIAIVLDDQVCSAPNVENEIAGGGTQISGQFKTEEAVDLANILSVGKLPTKTEIIEEAVVGPSLGQATVTAGLLSLCIGFMLVLAFMLIYYAFAGFISILTLFLNLFFIIGSLASFGTVLTLPGIAGIVLTIGMAVDANVIIYERIREELRNGSHWKDAILNGFSHSYSAIIDANVTTLIVAGILFQYGLGPIKGFATVLIVGVLCSVFSAVLIGRLLFDRWIERDKEVSVWTGATKNFLSDLNFDFVSKRKMAYAVSGLILVLGIASMFTRGFELGVDLRGGYSYTVEFPQAVNTSNLGDVLTKTFTATGLDNESADKTIIKTFNQSNQVKITTSFMFNTDDKDADEKVRNALFNACKEYAGVDATYENFVKPNAENAGMNLKAFSKVGPTIADDIQQSAYMASILALLSIFVYILARFRKWQFSTGALAALVHDVLFVLSIFSLFKGLLPFSLEIDQAFIAALLTVIGYSINDTVVVFDRIRETATNMEDQPLTKIVNVAVNNTLSRTFITSLTTFLVVAILFFFGGDGIRGFAFALLIGVLVGTYSSVFIATPVVVDTTGDVSDIKYDVKEEVAEEEETTEGSEETSTEKVEE